ARRTLPSRPFPRRDHGRLEAVSYYRARGGVLWTERRGATGRDPAHGAGPELPGRNRRLPHRARTRWPGYELAERLLESRRAQPGAGAAAVVTGRWAAISSRGKDRRQADLRWQTSYRPRAGSRARLFRDCRSRHARSCRTDLARDPSRRRRLRRNYAAD